MVRRKKGEAGEASKTEYNFWDTAHDGPFLGCLLELTKKGLISNGIGKNGVFRELQRMMEKKVPGCGLKSKPTIQNRYKKLKHWYHSTVMMRNQSGFGWDVQKECVTAENPVWDVFLMGAAFPKFFDLAPVFVNGHANGFAGISGNDPEIITEGEDSGSKDDEWTPIPVEEGVTLAEKQAMFDVINEGVEVKSENKKKRTAKNAAVGSVEKKKVQAIAEDNKVVEIDREMKSMVPLIKQFVDIIAKALGKSKEHDNMRKQPREILDKLEGLTRVQRVLGFRVLNGNPSDLESFYEMKDEDRLTLVLSLIAE